MYIVSTSYFSGGHVGNRGQMGYKLKIFPAQGCGSLLHLQKTAHAKISAFLVLDNKMVVKLILCHGAGSRCTGSFVG